MEKLLDKKCAYNTSDSDGYTPFMIAMNNQDTNIVTVFLRSRNFDVNKSDKLGMPPLLWAMKNRLSINMIELVLRYGRNATSVVDAYGDGVWEYYTKYYSDALNSQKMYDLLKKYE